MIIEQWSAGFDPHRFFIIHCSTDWEIFTERGMARFADCGRNRAQTILDPARRAAQTEKFPITRDETYLPLFVSN